MKKIIALLFVIVSLVISSCELEENIYDKYTPETLFNNEAGLRAGVIGGYSYLRHFRNYKNNSWWLPVLGHDLIFPIQGGVYFPSTDKSLLDSNNDAIQNPWSTTYQMINQANLILYYGPDINMNEEVKEEYLGHAYFLRAFGLLDLYRRHGGIVLPLEATVDATNLNKPISSAEETLAQIINDFTEASKRLPLYQDQSVSNSGLATKGAADGFLGLAYLYDGQYQMAINKFDEIINSGQYRLVDWDVLWDVTKEKEAYNEVLFGIQFINDPNASAVTALGSDLPSRFIWNNDPRSRGAGTFRVQRWFYKYATTGEYEGDYRSEMAMETTIPNKNNANNPLKTWPEPDAWGGGAASNNTSGYPFLSGKFIDESQQDDLRNKNNDYFFLRLSEIYLLKAEALNELNGPTQEVVDLFNKVRERARRADGTERTFPENLELSDVPTKDDFRLALVNEKAVEFVGEGVRWFDLRRIKRDNGQTMYQYILETWLPNYEFGPNSAIYNGVPALAKKAFVFRERDLWMPIPASEFINNPAVTAADQRPGW